MNIVCNCKKINLTTSCTQPSKYVKYTSVRYEVQRANNCTSKSLIIITETLLYHSVEWYGSPPFERHTNVPICSACAYIHVPTPVQFWLVVYKTLLSGTGGDQAIMLMCSHTHLCVWCPCVAEDVANVNKMSRSRITVIVLVQEFTICTTFLVLAARFFFKCV